MCYGVSFVVNQLYSETIFKNLDAGKEIHDKTIVDSVQR